MNFTQTEESSYQSLIELLDAGDYEACVRGCMDHIDEFGDSAKVWVLAGSALGASNRPNQARSALLCALELEPNHENAQVNYVTSCLHGGHKSDAIKAIKEFLPGMSDSCLAFKMAPSLAEALERGALVSTDLEPKVWIRIENILDSIEDELDRSQGTPDLVVEGVPSIGGNNVVQFPLQHPGAVQSEEAPFPIAHFVMEGGPFKSATLYIANNNLYIKAFDFHLASPQEFDPDLGYGMRVSDPCELASFLFADQPPLSFSFLKLARRDWERNGSDFYLFESICEEDKSLQGKQLVHGRRFEVMDYHFKKDAVCDVNMHDVLYPFSSAAHYSGYKRIDEVWSPPYLGEIVYKELKKEFKRLHRSIRKAG